MVNGLAFVELHHFDEGTVELSVGWSPQGWRGRVRRPRDSSGSIDATYSDASQAEDAARRLFGVIYPDHHCSDRCRRRDFGDSGVGS